MQTRQATAGYATTATCIVKRAFRVETVPDPVIQEPTDAVVRITSTGICGSDLHL